MLSHCQADPPKTDFQLVGIFSSLWQYGLLSFKAGDTKLERFWSKDEHTQRKWFNLRIGVVASCQKLDIILENKVI